MAGWYTRGTTFEGKASFRHSDPSLASMVLSQLFVAGIAIILCIAIHAAVTLLVVRVARRVSAKVPLPWQSTLLVATMVATVSALALAHVLEVGVWAETYAVVGAAPADADVLYFAFVNYTTLGYGELFPRADGGYSVQQQHVGHASFRLVGSPDL